MFCVWLFFCSSRRKHNDTVVTFSTLKSLGTHFQREKLLISNPGSLYNCSDLKVSNKHVKIMWGGLSSCSTHSTTISIHTSWLWSSTTIQYMYWLACKIKSEFWHLKIWKTATFSYTTFSCRSEMSGGSKSNC